MSGDPNTADLHHGEIANLEDLIDRESLREVCRSFFDLFGLSIRVFSSRGSLLANVHEERSICRYVNSLPQGRGACATTVGQAQVVIPTEQARATMKRIVERIVAARRPSFLGEDRLQALDLTRLHFKVF